MRFFLLVFTFYFIAGCSLLSPLQKSKFLTVNHLVSNSKFSEAKGLIDDLVDDEKSAQWHQTWYYKGLLCQLAHQEGVRKKDNKLTELYPDQLFVAYEAYEKARLLKYNKRYERKLLPRYVQLVNDFQGLGQSSFAQKKFETAQRAFEKALYLNQKPMLATPLDTNLLYNAAIAAYENNKWERAVLYLSRLDSMQHSVNASHLLFEALLQKADTVSALQVLRKSIDVYPQNDDLVLVLAEHYLSKNNTVKAFEIIDLALNRNDSLSYKLMNAKGLIYMNSDRNQEAIEVFERLVRAFPDQPGSYSNLATIYYNIGVYIEENARMLTSIKDFLAEKERSVAKFSMALEWVEKALEKKPGDGGLKSFAETLLRLIGGNNGASP